MNNTTARVIAGDDGIEVVLAVPAQAVAKAEQMAAKLGQTREQVLADYFADVAMAAEDGINDWCELELETRNN